MRIRVRFSALNFIFMSSVKERLQQFLKNERISGSEFARKMNVSPTYLTSMRKSMPEEKVERLMEVFPQLNRDWLLYGEGEMYREIGNGEIEPYHLHRHMVPLIPAHAMAGSLSMYAEGYSENDCKKVYTPVAEAEMAIQVFGDSMEPNITPGTFIFVKRINDKAFIPWGSPLLLDTENGSLVKLLYPSQKGEDYLEARSYNPAYPPFQIPTSSINGIFRILAQMKVGVMF